MSQSFIFLAVVYAGMLFVPGFLILRCARVPRILSLCCAPIISSCAISICGVLYAMANIDATHLTILLPLCALPSAILLIQRILQVRRPELSDKEQPEVPSVWQTDIVWWIPLIFAAVGIVICKYLFVSKIPSLDAVLQNFDVQHHLNTIRAFVNAKCISSLRVSFYAPAADYAIKPYGGFIFYPAAWHALCALFVQATGVTVPVAINVSLAVTLATAYPLGMCALASQLFPSSRSAIISCALTCVGFVMFPWCQLIFGPLYPNLIGFVLTPASMVLCMGAFQPDISLGQRARIGIVMLMALVGQALLHPNTVFTMYVILVPYVASLVHDFCSQRGFGKIKSAAAVVAFLALCAAFWTLCYYLPLFEAVKREMWSRFAWPWQEVINILTQTYTLFYFNEVTAQVILGILVIIGFVRAAYDSKLRWLPCSYILACILCFINATTFNDSLKRFLTAFWYTDSMRVCVTAILCAIPLAAYGFDWVYQQTCYLLEAYNERLRRPTHARLAFVALGGFFLLANFMPGFNWPGAHSNLTNRIDLYRLEGHEYDSNSFTTTFGDYIKIFKDNYRANAPIDVHENAFLADVKEVVGDDLVINSGYDGSILAYGMYDIRIYFRMWYGYGTDSETPESVLIRTSLSDYAENVDVREAVRTIGARYVLVLDDTYSKRSFLRVRNSLVDDAFHGIRTVTPDTAGFTEVLSSGMCHLYRIDDETS